MSNPISPLTPDEQEAAMASTAHEGYIHRVLVAFDIFVNVIFNGVPDETISSRSARAALDGKWWGIVMSAFLNLFQRDHGAQAMAGDTERAEVVESLDDHNHS